ncbi:hypothetical protein HN51_050488 [Arachis hypogaea]|uniref:RING-type E3 ubiquitin transferase n=1 Tax=Arachis hypogaea TaxID=3818 RepID=A0A444YB11_ARAHY|nr:RING-H2 finger protein ATL63 [Arachis hypogaea]QHN92254.1 RING-H2 finger protein [Arachis hypogaea]RYQ99124.1 hypothetical protein Ahy_B07g086997 [Arachis hypogaea]
MQTQNKSSNSLSQLAQSMFSSNNTIMLAAIVSLLLVILFVLLLHLYAKCFLSHSHPPPQQPPRRRRRHRRRATLPAFQGPPQFQFHHLRVEDSPFATKGLDSATVSAIPMFVYEAEKKKKTEQEEEDREELECVICLSGFEEGEMGRTLPKCGHAFHVECIDMWLSSHCNCPICRAPVVHPNDTGSVDDEDDDDVVQIVIGTPSYEISESENGNNDEDNNSVSVSGSETSYSSSSSSSLLLGCSFKRMLRKVFVS